MRTGCLWPLLRRTNALVIALLPAAILFPRGGSGQTQQVIAERSLPLPASVHPANYVRYGQPRNNCH
jgi:hypothetical protein